MKNFISILFMLILVGCGSPSFHSKTVYPYAVKFSEETCININSVNYALADAIPDETPGQTGMGYCIKGTKTIMLFKIDQWHNLQESEKEALLAHELGHCALGVISHNNKLDENEDPLSVMNHRIVDYVNDNNWDELKLTIYRDLIKLAKIKNKLKKDCIPITEQ